GDAQLVLDPHQTVVPALVEGGVVPSALVGDHAGEEVAVVATLGAALRPGLGIGVGRLLLGRSSARRQCQGCCGHEGRGDRLLYVALLRSWCRRRLTVTLNLPRPVCVAC